MEACRVDVAGVSERIGDSGAQFAVATWAALGLAALVWSIMCCSPDAEKKVQPARLGVWFLSWAGVTVIVGDLAREPFAWTVAGQLLLACSAAAAVAAPGCVRRPSAALALVLWGVTAALGYAMVRHAALGPGSSCPHYRRTARALAASAAVASLGAMVAGVVAAKAKRADEQFSYTVAALPC